MNDSGHLSKSKKRRQRKNRRKHCNNAEITPVDCDINEKNEEESVHPETTYTVLSPTDVKPSNCNVKKATKPIKSRSLDDDDIVKIQEISEDNESEESDKDNQAIVSEASESEIEWEETAEFYEEKPMLGSLSTTTLPLEGYYTDQVTLISPQEEKDLRDFLESLNLVNGPIEAVKQVCHKTTLESIKNQKKVKNKQDLEQYFLPICQHPRYLEVISEEASERESDLDEINLTKNLKRGTPELDLPPKVPPRPNRDRRRRLPTIPNLPISIEQAPPILLDTKIIETPTISEGFCNTTKTEEPSNFEVVFLHESSSNGSTEDGDTISNDSFTLEAENSDERSSSNECIAEAGECKLPANEMTEIFSSPISADDMSKLQNNFNDIAFEHQENTSELLRNNNVTTLNRTREKLSRENEMLITSSSSAYNCSVKTFTTPEQTIIDNAILSELTPPPTPENMSPKSGVYVNNNFDQQILQTIINPTKDLKSDQISNELEEISHNMMKPDAAIYTSVYSPPPPPSRSSSSEESSSRESSLSTAKYIPSQSSITDVTELNMEEEGVVSKVQPLTLREICLKFLLKLPFGTEVLQELAEVSKRIESFTSSLPSSVLPKLYRNQAQFVQKTHTDPNIISSELSVQKQSEKMSEVKSLPKEFNIPVKREPNEIRLGLTEKEKANLLLHKSCLKEGSVSVSEKDIVKAEEDLAKILENQYIPVERRIPIKKDWTVCNETKEIPSTLNKETPINIESKIKERIIPITINASAQRNESKLQHIINQSNYNNKNPSKEIQIPIRKDWENSLSKSIDVIPVQPPKRSFNKRKEVNIPILKEWVGLPTEKDPTILACLSPKQKVELDKSKKISDEADTLLDLHQKFINRRHSHEETIKEVEDRITITGFNKNITDISPSNRLLTIIKEEPSTIHDDISYLYFIEKEPRLGTTLPRRLNTENARLKARDLTEWLQLARNKSMSESNLSTVPDYPENNLRNIFNEPPTASKHRRTSLPQEFYEKQMIYLQEKEREIQKQLEELEDEKRKINAELSSSKQFRPEDFIFSKKGDYAENKFRPSLNTVGPTEILRQQMYEEYMDKVAEREERKQQKIIKVTSSKDSEQTSENAKSKEIIHPIHLEEEFMDKVKQKQAQGKLEKTKSTEIENSVEKDEDEPVLVIDGEEVKEAKGLPKHLQEFVHITKLADSGYGKFYVSGVICRFVLMLTNCESCIVFIDTNKIS